MNESESYRCDIEGCGYLWTGPAFERASVERRHMLHRHDVIAEADAIRAGQVLPAAHPEARQPGCSCPLEVWDPECPVHAQEANW